MIGRTLDAMLSPLQIIGRECRIIAKDSTLIGESPLLYLVDAMRDIVLPLTKYSYHTYEEDDVEKTVLSDDNWSIYFPDAWELKRECAKAFEKRKSVKVGESFSLDGTLRTGFGTFNKNFGVERIGKNAVTYRGHLISSDKKNLLECKDKGYTPVLYRGVIW